MAVKLQICLVLSGLVLFLVMTYIFLLSVHNSFQGEALLWDMVLISKMGLFWVWSNRLRCSQFHWVEFQQLPVLFILLRICSALSPLRLFLLGLWSTNLHTFSQPEDEDQGCGRIPCRLLILCPLWAPHVCHVCGQTPVWVQPPITPPPFTIQISATRQKNLGD